MGGGGGGGGGLWNSIASYITRGMQGIVGRA